MSADHSQKTYIAKAASRTKDNPGVRIADVERNWWVIDAKGKVLGRLAQEIAMLLMGKHKPTYTPNVDTGDFVVVLNAGQIDVTGNKRKGKTYDRYTGYPGGRREETFENLNARRPGEPLRLAVKRMLPKNNLGRKMLTKLRLFEGQEHTHQAQNPKAYEPTGRAAIPQG